MHDLDDVPNAIKYLVGIASNEDDPHVRIVCAITAMWMDSELLDRVSDSCRYISRASGRSLT